MFEREDDPAFAGQVGYSGLHSNSPLDRLPGDTSAPRVVRHNLDGERATTIYKQLIGHYHREMYRQNENRVEMAKDAAFYDGDQYDAETKRLLGERGQAALVYNVITTTINWLLGTEKRGRTDYKIAPRRKEGSKAAERKTQLLKYLSDTNRSEFHVSRAFADMVKVGVGWLECGVRDEEDGAEPIYDRYESWRNILWDSASTEFDIADGRYLFRAKWTDTDAAKATFKAMGRDSIIEASAADTFEYLRNLYNAEDDPMDEAEEEMSDQSWGFQGDASPERSRVRIIEAWFRMPSEDEYISGGDFTGELFDHSSDGHMSDVGAGRARIVRKVRMRMFVAIMTEVGLIYMGKSPYRHNRYPFTPIWCYRRDSNNLPYGVIRQLRGPQTDINARVTKALHILSTNKVIMDEGAVDDLEALEDEVSRPDAIIIKKQNKELKLDVDRELAPAHLDLMARSIQMIQQIGGVTDENMGRTTNATSGKAITARQDQGALANATLFDNLRLSRQVHGEKQLSLIEQFMDQQKQFRITNMRGNPEFVTVNDGLPENDIIRTKADFIISEDDWNSTIRQAQVAELLEVLQIVGATAPQVVLVMLDLLVEAMDLPQREELVKRIRQITGVDDPDADPENPDPETIARKQAEQEKAALEKRMAVAEIEEKEAKARKTGAEADRITNEVARILAETAGKNVETQVRALEAAAQILALTQAAPVADAVLQSAGYVDQAGPPAAPAPPHLLPPAPPAPPQPTYPEGGIL